VYRRASTRWWPLPSRDSAPPGCSSPPASTATELTHHRAGALVGDYADLTTGLVELVAPGRRLLFLEGGYDLDALADCTGAVLSALGR
jgi:hypothetical protein